MSNIHKTQLWFASHPLTALQIDCVITVMLKIMDGKCKMCAAEKIIMSELYDAVKHQSGKLFDEEFHTLIATARQQPTEELKDHIYEKRVLAETMLSRPVMKEFKAMIRAQGLLDMLDIVQKQTEF